MPFDVTKYCQRDESDNNGHQQCRPGCREKNVRAKRYKATCDVSLSQAGGAHTCRWPMMMRVRFSWEQVRQLRSKPSPAMLRLQSGSIRVSARSQSPTSGVRILRSTKACQSGPSMLAAIPPRRGRHAVGGRFGFPGRMPRVGEGARAFATEGLGSPAAVSWAAVVLGCRTHSRRAVGPAG